ncbi:autism susceptibility gene 2 protein homolog isoform X2 [Cylas formicarius]|uniref:autism susceptibility gene 2 protein homolog isoform X2 n=1 Tax=Cylas formicarius TaxID=197179 RepID=UPI002958A953|nr:autism susceptibility gene 2 protein homolog isoform X2 [Cylas formicarius]
MEIEVKQRNRRRKRAQRMQQELKETKANKANADESEAEDVIPKKPPRPPNRRKKQKELLKEPLCEEDIVDGFSILQFRSYEDLELVVKIAAKEGIKRLTEVERPKLEPKAHITNHILVHNNNHGLTLTQDPATSDDSGRASERLTGSSVAPRDADSSRDRLSDASSRCSSGKGYICDSEGEDDKGSDASSVIFASTPSSRKHEFPGALPPSLPQSLPHGPGSSPVPAPTPPNLPAPSPAPAQQPPNHPAQSMQSATAPPPLPKDLTAQSTVGAVKSEPMSHGKIPIGQVPDIGMTAAGPPPTIVAPQPPPPSVPLTAVSMPQPAAAPTTHHPLALDSSGAHPGVHGPRTDSPAVATSANAAVAPSPGQFHHSYQPIYAPYAHSGASAYPSSVSYPATNTTSISPSVPPAHSQTVSSGGSAPTQSLAVPSSKSHHQVTEQSREKRAISPAKPTMSPRIETRERESYSNVTSLSRSSVQTTAAPQYSFPAPTTTVSSSLTAVSASPGPAAPPAPLVAKPWAAPATAAPLAPAPVVTRLSPAPPRPTPPLHTTASYPGAAPPPMFAPPPVSTASPLAPAAPTVAPNPNPFSAESLFQTNQADMLRRELDNRFLASQDRALGVAPPPYLRTEMHQHQHHHTHVHQHTTSLLPPPGASALFSSQLPLSPMERLARRTQSSFKDITKIGAVESPFYRQNLGMPSYAGYNPGLIGHPGLTTGPTPFVPPNHLPTFQPKSLTPQDPSKPRILKSGKWNAMHVRVAWEIYHHQQKSGEAKGVLAAAAAAATKTAASDLLRTPSHLFSPSVHSSVRPHELAPFPPSALTAHRPPGFEQPPHHAGSLFSAPATHLGKSPFSAASSMSPFTRYGAASLGPSASSPFSVSPFGASRESHLGLGPLHHDPWRTLQRTMPAFPPAVNPLPPTLPGLPPGPAPWTIKPDPVLEQREREAREREERERERLRREREERERREREEKQRRLEQQERERERREKERREMERRENERREREREMMLHQQRLAAESAAKQIAPPVIRDRSPLRNGQPDLSEIRVKEEPRSKEEDLLARGDPRGAPNFRYHHPFLRHPGSLQPPPPSVLDRSRMLAHALPSHYPPAATHWPPHTVAADPFYRYGYSPLMDQMRMQDDRAAASFFAAYGHPAHHPSQLRPKDPSLLHLRGGPGPPPPPPVHKMSATPPTDLHKKEEPR